MIKTPHKGIQGEVGRSHEGVVTGIRERGPPLSRLLVKDEGNLLVHNNISIIWKDDIDFFHAGCFEQ